MGEIVTPLFGKDGTKASALYRLRLSPGASSTHACAWTNQEPKIARISRRDWSSAALPDELLGQNFASILALRRKSSRRFSPPAPGSFLKTRQNVHASFRLGAVVATVSYHLDVRTG